MPKVSDKELADYVVSIGARHLLRGMRWQSEKSADDFEKRVYALKPAQLYTHFVDGARGMIAAQQNRLKRITRDPKLAMSKNEPAMIKKDIADIKEMMQRAKVLYRPPLKRSPLKAVKMKQPKMNNATLSRMARKR